MIRDDLARLAVKYLDNENLQSFMLNLDVILSNYNITQSKNDQVEELSDRAIPFLIFNMAIRGMNGSITQCDCLSRKATRAFFIKNDTDNYLGFSEVIELPKNQEVAELLNVHWEI